MKSIINFGRKGKVKKAETVAVQKLEEYGALAIDEKAALIQELIPLGLMHILEIIKEEVVALAGDRHRRDGRAGSDRWGTQQGSMYVQDERIPIQYQRVRETRPHNSEPPVLRAVSESHRPGERQASEAVIIQAALENEAVCKDFLKGLIIPCGSWFM